MASTYTVNIGIEKPGTGDQSGTWGTTTNTNFDIIDQATNGVATVTLASAGTSGSPNTLLITNGALSDGRNRFIEFNDGADLGATAYVQLDPNDAEKIVHIRNSLSGSRSLILFQGTYNASNDFEVPNGADVLVKFDGGGASATVTDVNVNLTPTKVTTGDLDVDNINIDGNAITSTDTNGNIALTPDGTGEVDISKVDIDSGTIDNTTIGGSTPAAGSFTTVTGSGDMNIDSGTLFVDVSENRVGIGTSSPSNTITVRGPSTNGNSSLGNVARFEGPSGTNGFLVFVDDSENASGIQTINADDLLLNPNGGKVGIGTSSPDTNLEISSSSFGTALKISTTAVQSAVGDVHGKLLFEGRNASGTIYTAGEINTVCESTAGTRLSGMTFSTSGPTPGALSEKMRIDSSGRLLIGTTTAGTTHAYFAPTTNDRAQFNLGSSVTTNTAIASFNNPNGSVGSISTNGSATAYNTSSDYRLKEDWVPMSDSIARIKALNPVNFAWKVDGTRVDGFLAHEAQEIVPEAISGTKDAVIAYGNITDAKGNIVQENVVEPETLEEGQTWTKVEDRPDYQGIDQSKLVPLLTAALQEAIGRIETLEAEVTALKGA